MRKVSKKSVFFIFLGLVIVYRLVSFLMENIGAEKVISEYGGEIYLFEGRFGITEKILEKPPPDPSGGSISGPYFDPFLSPDQNEMVCVGGSCGGSEEYCEELFKYSFKEKKKEPFFKTSSVNGHLGSPIWSLDGKFIYFLNGFDLFSYELNSETTKKLASIPIDGFRLASFQPRYVNSIYDRIKTESAFMYLPQKATSRILTYSSLI